MSSPVKQNWSATPNVWGFDNLSWAQFEPVATVGASQASDTVIGTIVFPFAVKVALVAVYTAAIGALDGSHQFNIASGSGSYETGEDFATGQYVLSGTPLTGFDNVYTIDGHAVTVAQATGRSLAQQATADAAAINSDGTVGALVVAVGSGADVNLTALIPGPGGNYTTTASDTPPTFGTGSYTITGSPADGETNTYTIDGHAVVAPQATANSDAQQATADAAAINADVTVGALVHAVASGADINLTSLTPGAAGNYTTVGTSSAGDTVTANQGALVGGASGDTLTAGAPAMTGGGVASGITLPPNDNSTSGPYPGGLGIPTVFGAPGDALFSPDVSLTATAGVGNAPTTDQPALPTPTTGGDSVWRFVPNNYDAVWPAGTVFTLRGITPPGGSITDLVVSLGFTPVRVPQSINSQGLYIIPGVNF